MLRSSGKMALSALVVTVTWISALGLLADEQLYLVKDGKPQATIVKETPPSDGDMWNRTYYLSARANGLRKYLRDISGANLRMVAETARRWKGGPFT